MAKILIIDDDGIVREALSVFLMREGHRVLAAADGLNGVQLFKAETPDLVVLDRNLPLLTGSGVFEKIREISGTVPIVMLTGNDDPEEGKIYLKHGAAAFLSKGDGLSRALGVIDELLGPVPGPVPGPDPGPEKGRASLKPLLLVAEDDEQMRGVLRRFLLSAGFEVAEAADGLQAEKLARELKPDIVLLDIYMPGKNGVDVLETLARELPDTGVIMVSGNEDEQVARDCLNKGAFDYVPKPPNFDTLEYTIRSRLFLQGCRL